MKPTRLLCILVLMLASSLAPGMAAASGKPGGADLAREFTTVLQPGVWHGWVVGPAADGCGFAVEVTPLRPLEDGAHVQAARVLPEFDGARWSNVLRVQIPDWQERLPARIQVYRLCDQQAVYEAEVLLKAGEWTGLAIGPAAENRGYLIDIDPLELSVDGAYVDKAIVQQEYPWGEWLDVLRLQTSVDQPDLLVRVRLYAIQNLPIFSEFEACLEPGVWHGFYLQPSREQGGFVVETSPLDPPEAGEYVARVAVQPEFNGKYWNDILRLQAVEGQPGICVQVRVYRWLP